MAFCVCVSAILMVHVYYSPVMGIGSKQQSVEFLSDLAVTHAEILGHNQIEYKLLPIFLRNNSKIMKG